MHSILDILNDLERLVKITRLNFEVLCEDCFKTLKNNCENRI